MVLALRVLALLRFIACLVFLELKLSNFSLVSLPKLAA